MEPPVSTVRVGGKLYTHGSEVSLIDNQMICLALFTTTLCLQRASEKWSRLDTRGQVSTSLRDL
jgi:hypothetical protein